MLRCVTQFGVGAFAISSIVIACGDGGGNSEFEDGVGGSSASGGASNGGTNNGGTAGSIRPPPDGGGATTGDGGGGVCGNAKAQARLQPVFLAFAFDASASMGSTFETYYRKDLKWDPIEAATKAFFADPASRGISASMTFFPTTNTGNRCNASSYGTPNVPMTALNGSASNPFSTALDQVDPTIASRTATPTEAVMNGVITYVQGRRTSTPGAYAIVLVTDGVPDQCPVNDVSRVEAEARRALQAGFRTYVIGVNNPPPGPNTLGFLNGIATAGGTSTAHIIATGDPSATITAFRNAVNQIRSQAVSCNLPIPPAPAGQTFNKNRVRVLYSSGANPATTFTYDQNCAAANAWKYNNLANPTEIVLCPSTCTTVQANPQAAINVEFTCSDVIDVPDPD
ncbi:MAG TPA: vWA domain-containing protein [Polyangiaceae bacterium]|nr:vWA domain-containing protein [Polyangiaceae bacterium]